MPEQQPKGPSPAAPVPLRRAVHPAAGGAGQRGGADDLRARLRGRPPPHAAARAAAGLPELGHAPDHEQPAGPPAVDAPALRAHGRDRVRTTGRGDEPPRRPHEREEGPAQLRRRGARRHRRGPPGRPRRPQHRGGLRLRSGLRRRGRRPRLRGGVARAFETWRDVDPGRAPARPAALRRRGRGARRRAGRAGEPEHRQAAGPDVVGGDPADGRPDPVLRRRRPHPGGQGRGRVHGRAHQLDPAGADRGRRPGDARGTTR